MNTNTAWMIRQTAIAGFNEYAGEQADELKEKLKILTLNDPRSFVRAEALGTLSSLPNGEDNTELYRKAMEDRSYTVAATALFTYLATDPADAATQVAKFESSTTCNGSFKQWWWTGVASGCTP